MSKISFIFPWGQRVNSLALGEFEWNFRHAIFRKILVIDDWGISCEIVIILMSLDFTEDQSTLVQVMAWCRQATSHYMSQCWPRSLSPGHNELINGDYYLASNLTSITLLWLLGLNIGRDCLNCNGVGSRDWWGFPPFFYMPLTFPLYSQAICLPLGLCKETWKQSRPDEAGLWGHPAYKNWNEPMNMWNGQYPSGNWL